MRMRLLASLWALVFVSLCADVRAQDIPVIDLATDNIAVVQPEAQVHHHHAKYVRSASEANDVEILGFDATRHPFVPQLLKSEDSNICVPFFTSVQEYFFAGQKRNKEYIFGWGALPSGTFDIEGGKWFGGKPEVIRVPAKDGQKPYTVLIIQQAGIHMSFQVPLYVKPEEVKQEEIDKLSQGNYIRDDEMAKSGWKLAAEVRTGGDVHLHLLWFNHTLYLYKNGLEEENGHNSSDVSPNAVSLYLIEPTGNLQETCKVLAAPETETAGPPDFRGHKEVENTAETKQSPVIETPPALKKFFDMSEEIVGTSLNSQPCQGTDGPYVWARYYNNRNVMRYEALARPWDLADDSDLGGLVDFMNRWGVNSLYNYRIYQKIASQTPKATKALADFYREAYGLPKSQAYPFAENAMGKIMNASFATSSRPDSEVQASIETDGDKNAFRQRYRDALASKTLTSLLMEKAVLLGMIDLVKNTPKEVLGEPDIDLANERWVSPDFLREPFIFYALDNDKMLTLLIDKGRDVNSKNWFGKTPLMYAAQWNMPKTVNVLLAHHADINITTKPTVDNFLDCSGAPKIGGRTALMYAAENASAPLIEALLQAGADAKAKDSKGRSVQDYLANNKLLSDNERKELSALITQ